MMSDKSKTSHLKSRKTKKTPKYIEPLLDNLRAGLSIHAACSQAGLTARTVEKWRHDDPDFSAEFDAAIDYSEATLIAEVRQYGRLKEDWRAPLALLERRFPSRWSLKRDLEVKVNDKNDGSGLVASMLAQATEAITGQTIDDKTKEDNQE